MTAKPRTRQQWEKWASRVREGQMQAQKRAYEKSGLSRRQLFKRREKKEERAQVKKSTKKAPGSRFPANVHGLACTECWGQPETLRSDGISMPRHDPASEGAALYRDTQFCAGQGRAGVVVLDDAWVVGSKPKKTVPGKKWLNGEAGDD